MSPVVFSDTLSLREIPGVAMDIREHDVVISMFSVKMAIVDHE
jgi:hypothetical protein